MNLYRKWQINTVLRVCFSLQYPMLWFQHAPETSHIFRVILTFLVFLTSDISIVKLSLLSILLSGVIATSSLNSRKRPKSIKE